MMREFGLILENQDGFGNLAMDFNMRGVPHTLALATSVASPDGPRLGWSGDGAPAPGIVRAFAIGAVKQHFTLTLNRNEDPMLPPDFRLPTDDELDALAAFQLSLGRQEELSLPLPLSGIVAARGQEIFLDPTLGKCNQCHLNAGANRAFGGGGNANFDTGVEALPDQPAEITGEFVLSDDGFGTPGDDTFNTPTVVEAADTGPFFHNNAIETIEGAVAFYNGDAFDTSAASTGLFPIEINLDATQVEAVAAFLRVINALENIRSAIALGERASDAGSAAEEADLLELALADTRDAIQVLGGGGLHPHAVNHLEEAEILFGSGDISEARERLEDARDLLVDE